MGIGRAFIGRTSIYQQGVRQDKPRLEVLLAVYHIVSRGRKYSRKNHFYLSYQPHKYVVKGLEREVAMAVSRQDAWTHDEDLILAEIVLRHIREGSTQLTAFEEVGKRLSRTSAACGFRWNSYVRKQYISGIELAKKQRKENKKALAKTKVEQVPEQMPDKAETGRLQLEDVIAFITSLHEGAGDEHAEGEKLLQQYEAVKRENERLEEEILALKKKVDDLEEDYRALIEIMDKARKMVILEENKKVKFHMDKNGNLESMKK